MRDGGFHQGDDRVVVWGRAVLVASALDDFKGVKREFYGLYRDGRV